jgi:hypothetical protein
VTNKRLHERLEIALPVILSFQGRDIRTTTRNLSAGGMLIDGGTDLPFGANVRLRCTLPGQELDVVCTVRWIKDGAIGVQFGSLRAKETWALHQLIKQLSDAKPT